jgi:hypothetical protein
MYILDDILGYFGDKAKADAAKQAQAQNTDLIQGGRDALAGAAGTANDLLAGAIPGVTDSMAQGYQGAADMLTQGYGQQRQDILQGGQLGNDAITGGMSGALGALAGRSDRSGQMLDQPGGMYGNYQADPGYQFRLQQGEDGIRRMQAAQGGRFGGAAMKALVDYDQNMASQEFGNYVNRANSEFGARSGVDDRSLSAANSAAGVYGSGANQLADIAGRTGAQLGAQAAGAGGTLGALAGDYYGGLAGLERGTAQQMGQNIMSGAGASSQLIPGAISNNNMTIDNAGLGWDAAANATQSAGNIGATLAGLLT